MADVFIANGITLTDEERQAVSSLGALAQTPAGYHLAKDNVGDIVNTPDSGGGGSSIQPVITVSTSQSIVTNQHVRANAASGSITLTLTNPTQEETVTIKKIDSTSNSVFITSPSLIDGSTTAELSMKDESVTLKFTGLTYDIT